MLLFYFNYGHDVFWVKLTRHNLPYIEVSVLTHLRDPPIFVAIKANVCYHLSKFFNLFKYLNLQPIDAKMQVCSLTVGLDIMIPDVK